MAVEVCNPDRYRFWSKLNYDCQISRGSGLSYTAASFASDSVSVSLKSFNRIISFDSENHFIEVEAGISLLEVFNFLYARGFYLPIQPGHGSISIGGCIACDVHGKNQFRDGTFINQVEALNLFHPDHGMISCDRKINSNIFYLTCGGYGLTGHIVTVKLRIQTYPSKKVNLQISKFGNYAEGFSSLIEKAEQSDFVYTWHNMSYSKIAKGSGLIFSGNFSYQSNEFNEDKCIESVKQSSIASNNRGNFSVNLFNKYTSWIINKAYELSQVSSVKSISLGQMIYPAQNSEFYFKLFGSRGFHEYQVILPVENIHKYIQEIYAFAKKLEINITLGSAKFFAGKKRYITFVGDGICFSLNFTRGSNSMVFIKYLDSLLVDFGGIPNIIKDSRLPLNIANHCFPEIDNFREALRSFDPKRKFQSELSERLKL